MPRPPLALLACALIAAACSSTVQTSSTVTQGTTGDGLGTTATTGTTAPLDPGSTGSTGGPGGTSTSGTTGFSGSGTGGSASSGGSTTGTTTGSGPTSGPVPAGVNARGVTAKEIKVGLLHDPNAGALNQAAGASGLTSGDSKADELAVIDDINRHGGVGGRKLVPVYATVDSTSTQTEDQQFAGVCQKFTRDEPVFVAAGPGPESYVACMAKAGIPVLDDDLPRFGRETFAKYPGFLEQGYPNVDRLAAYHVGPLVAQKYFTPWNTVTGQPAATGTVKVGVLTYNDKVFAGATSRYLVPSLKKLGYDPVVVQVATNKTASDVSGQAAAVQSAQLQFASRGVTHVLIFEAKAALGQFFMANARSQGYYPRYGFNSANGPQALYTAGLMTRQQANGSVGYGWLPNLDLNPELNPDNGPYANPLRRKCAKVMRDHGISFDSSNAQGIGYIACTTLYLVDTAVERIPGAVNAQSFLQAVGSLGATFQPAGGLGTEGQVFRPGRNDPQEKAYFLHFDNACTCFKYSGSIQTIP